MTRHLLSRWRRKADGFHVDVVCHEGIVGCMVPIQDGVKMAYLTIAPVVNAKNPEAAAAQWARKTAQAGRERFLMDFHHVRAPGE